MLAARYGGIRRHKRRRVDVWVDAREAKGVVATVPVFPTPGLVKLAYRGDGWAP